MERFFLSLLLTAFIAFDVQASTVKIQSDIHDLKDLGYTGKGVKVGVMDHFERWGKYQPHGELVVSFIRSVAPNVEIETTHLKELSGFDYRDNSAYQEIKKQLGSISLKVGEDVNILAIKASEIKNVDDLVHLVSDHNAPTCQPNKFEQLTFLKGQAVTITLFKSEDDLYEFSYQGQKYYSPLMTFYVPQFKIHVSENLKAPIVKDNGFKAGLEKLMDQKYKIINLSQLFNASAEEEGLVEKFASSGGVLIKAAGNKPLTLGERDVPLKDAGVYGPSVEVWDSVQWHKMLQSDAKKACLVVGALKRQEMISDYTAKSGIVKKKFIAAIVDEEEGRPLGTSFAAPQITGVMALLQEAFPTCPPQTLKKAILKSGASSVVLDPLGDLIGRGLVDPLAAFKKTYELCGMPPQGLKGQKYLLPVDFKVEAYLSLNPNVNDQTTHMTPAEKEAFGIQHYLEHGSKEGRLYKGQSFPPDFDADAYIYAHPDLTAHTKVMTPAQRRLFAYEHYLAHGKKEGRAYLPSEKLQNFNPDTYLFQHADVKEATQGMTPEDARSFAYWHYMHHGQKEGRLRAPEGLPQWFNPQRYLELNPDVKNHTKSMSSVEASSFAVWHYINHGKDEKRTY